MDHVRALPIDACPESGRAMDPQQCYVVSAVPPLFFELVNIQAELAGYRHHRSTLPGLPWYQLPVELSSDLDMVSWEIEQHPACAFEPLALAVNGPDPYSIWNPDTQPIDLGRYTISAVSGGGSHSDRRIAEITERLRWELPGPRLILTHKDKDAKTLARVGTDRLTHKWGCPLTISLILSALGLRNATELLRPPPDVMIWML